MRPNIASPIVTSTAIIAIAIACTGCYEELDPAPQAQTTSSSGGDATAHPMDAHLSQGGGSALGGAKRSAESTADKIDEYQKKVSDAADDALDDN